MDLARPFAVITPTLDGAVLQALTTVKHMESGAEIHRRCGTGSPHGVRKVLHRLVAQGVADEVDNGNVKYYRLDSRHLAYEAIAQLANLTGLLADRVAHFLDGVAGLTHASFISLDPVTVLLVADNDTVRDGAAWQYRLRALRQAIREWTGEPARTHDLTLANLSELAREDDPEFLRWREAETHLAGTNLFLLRRAARG
jgi:hypothetical protein